MNSYLQFYFQLKNIEIFVTPRNSPTTNVNAPALYNEQSKINMFMKNFDRDNDTTYIIYFNYVSTSIILYLNNKL